VNNYFNTTLCMTAAEPRGSKFRGWNTVRDKWF